MRPLLAVALFAAPAVAADPLPTKLQTDTFRVRLPAEPDIDAKELAVGGGRSVPVSTYKATDPKSGAVFSVSVAEYPPAFTEVPADTLLDGVRDGLKGKDGKVKREDRSKGGRTVVIEAGRNLMHARLLLVGTRLFQVTVAGPAKTFPEKTAQQFLDGFEPVGR